MQKNEILLEQFECKIMLVEKLEVFVQPLQANGTVGIQFYSLAPLW